MTNIMASMFRTPRSSRLTLVVMAVVMSLLVRHSVNRKYSSSPSSSSYSTYSRALDAIETPPDDNKTHHRGNKKTDNGHSISYNILTLGGSVTWGAKLPDRTQAYPHVLANLLGNDSRVVNLAIRATGADFASQCIETMIRDGTAGGGEDDADEFDVIVLEFSLNGLDGLSLLIDRLKRRYPNAIFVFVHLWSVRMAIQNAKTGDLPRLILKEGHSFKDADRLLHEALNEPNVEWMWHVGNVAESHAVMEEAGEEMKRVGGYLFWLPYPDDPKEALGTLNDNEEGWFSEDYHHLGVKGHEMVAEGIVKKIQEGADNYWLRTRRAYWLNKEHPDTVRGTWGEGDQCYSWFEKGQSSLKHTGGKMKSFANDKFAHHISEKLGTGTIEFPNMKSTKQPLGLTIMAYGEPSKYPKSNVELKSLDDEDTTERQAVVQVDPLHPVEGFRKWHVTNTVDIGWASPGRNVLEITPVETTRFPLRVTGLVMCGACVEMSGGTLSLDEEKMEEGDGVDRDEEEVDGVEEVQLQLR